MSESKIIYQVIPTYKNIPQIMFIKQFDDKESVISYVKDIKDDLNSTISSRIDNSETMSNKEKVFESLNIQNNLNFVILGINELSKNNKLYEIVVDEKGKYKLQSITINKGAELPQIDVISYIDTTVYPNLNVHE